MGLDEKNRQDSPNNDRTPIETEFTFKNVNNSQNISGSIVETIDINNILQYFNDNIINFKSVNVSESLEVGNLEFINSSTNSNILDISNRLTILENSFNQM
jgi:hypothetical protein